MGNPLDQLFKRNGTLVDHLFYVSMEEKLGGVLARAEMVEKTAGSEWVKGHFRGGEYVSGYRREEDRKPAKKEFAPGLPSKKRMTPLPVIEEGKSRIWEFGVHDHYAIKRGRHFDLRLGDPRTGIAHSWSLTALRLPESGKPIYGKMQPDHTVKYMDFKGTIGEGYGAGRVDLHKRGKTEIIYSSPTRIKFATYEGREISEYALIKMGKTDIWKMYNVTATRERHPDLPSSKPKYKETRPEKIDLSKEDEIIQAKVDGAHVLVEMNTGKQTRVFSYRPTERKTGVIDHTQRVPGVLGHRGDKAAGKTLLRGEVYAIDKDGKALPAQDVGGMLNANVWKSRALQEEKGKLTTAIFDVVKHRGKNVESAPYSEKLRILREIVARDPDLFHMPDTAETQEEKEKLYKDIQEGEHKQTSEGVIVWKKDEAFPPTKAKHRPDFDIHVRKVFPAFGKDGKELDRAGGFEYSHTPDGPIVGKVGTGFDHKTLRDMKANPDKYVGRAAKVRSLEKMRGKGALRAPSFSEWHMEKGKEAAAKPGDVGSGTLSGESTQWIGFEPVAAWSVGENLILLQARAADGLESLSLHKGAEAPNDWQKSTVASLTLVPVGPDRLEIKSMYVDPEHRRQGLGKMLTGAITTLHPESHIFAKPDPFKDRAVSTSTLRAVYGSYGFQEVPGHEHMVRVARYTRKDGTHVKAHTREKTAGTEGWTPSKIHKIADKLGIAWDDDPKFKRFSEEVTGVSCLDKMSPAQRKSLAAALVRRAADGGKGLAKQGAEEPGEADIRDLDAERATVKRKKVRKTVERLDRAQTKFDSSALDAGQRETLAHREDKSYAKGGGLEDNEREMVPGSNARMIRDKRQLAEKLSAVQKSPYSPQVKRSIDPQGKFDQLVRQQLEKSRRVSKFEGAFNPRKVPRPINPVQLAPRLA